MSSLPVPLSPEIKTGEFVRAARLVMVISRRIDGRSHDRSHAEEFLVDDFLGVTPFRPDRVSLVGVG